MRITQLIASNVLALKAVDIIIPDGQNVVEISGANGAGKSSCLASIMWALCGGNEIPEKPVHEGADEAVAEVVLDGKFRVKRTIKPDRKSRLEITGADGVKSTSGQKLLNDLLDIRTIDPMRFARLGETADGLKEQREVLLSMLQLPFDLKAERAKYAGLYELRREKKRELDGIEKLMKSVERPTVDVNGSKEISGVAVAERLAAAEREVAANTAIRQAAARAQAATESIVMDRNRLALREGIDNSALLNHQRIVDEAGVELAKMPDVEQEILKLTANIQTLEETLADLRVKLSTASKARQTREVVKGRIERGLIMVENDKATLTATRTELAELSADVEKAKAIEAEAHVKADALVDPNLDTIRAELKAVEIRNGHIRKAAEFRKTERIFLDKQAEVDAIQGDMDAIKAKVDAALEGATYPVPGLGVSETQLTWLDPERKAVVPWESLSSARQLEIATAIALARNPKIKVCLFRDASLLDSKTLARVAKIAEQYGGQIWLERVDETGKVGIVITDGEVSAVNV